MYDRASDYDYHLPDELIARHPPAHRTDARLLVVDRSRRELVHSTIANLPQWLSPHDCLVLNDTKVIRARLLGTRVETGGKWEGLFLDSPAPGAWRLLCQTRGRLRSGEKIVVHRAHAPDSPDRLELRLGSKADSGVWMAEPVGMTEPLVPLEPFELLEHFGTVPLPPYMHRDLADETDFDRYQTTFAHRPGSVAAPTAGLHFTPELLQACRDRGVESAFVTLHVGIGTFRPLTADLLSEHRLHGEWCEVSPETVERIAASRSARGRIVAVGTTSTRSLETAAHAGRLHPWRGIADLFIRPPFEFRAIDCLLTNFHLPRSSLLVLVAALAGHDLVMKAYQEAVRERYRFFSYGDAMLVV